MNILLRHIRTGMCLGRTPAIRNVATSTGHDRSHFINMKNGEKAPSLFSNAEHERRLTQLRAYMSAHDISAAIFTSYHNILYYSGFLYCYFGRPYGLIVTHDDSVTISAAIDGGQPWRRSFGGNLVYTDWKKDNFYRVIQEQLKGTENKIGLELDNMPVQIYDKLDAVLSKNPKVDIGTATMGMRMLKSPEEIAIIREGARIADMGGAAVVNVLQEGVSEVNVSLAATDAMTREIAAQFPQSEIRDTWTWFQSGINTDGAHNPVTTRKVQSGDILSANCFPMIQGYYTALERTLFMDHASDDHLKLWEINCDVHRHGCNLIKPGVKCKDIATQLNELYAENDLLRYRSFGYGHSFGILCHYYGREAGLELREDIDTVLEPGMVVSMEPMIMIPEGKPGSGGYREHDILILTQDGAENITKFPFGPEHNIIRN